MADYAGEVEIALARLGELAETGALVDVYLTASLYRGEAPVMLPLAVVAPADILYYGGQNAAELLAQFEALRQGRSYEAILVLTDGSGYQLGQGEIDVPRPAAPVWMVHLGGDFPPGYDDDTLEAIQASGGGVAGGLEEALNRLAVALAAPSQAAGLDLIDGYTWLTLPAGEAEALNDQAARVSASDPFAAIAARRLILAEMARRRVNLDQAETLDEIHAIAVEQSIVTPYSSMIVLVNQEQEQRLNRLENQADRFEREIEEVGETAPDLSVTGVPEPEEWLLLALAAGLLGWYWRNRLRLRPGRAG
jgi:putative PEP-CTERM system integral membrane protein